MFLCDVGEELREGMLYISRLQSINIKRVLKKSESQSRKCAMKKMKYVPVIIRSPSALERTSASSNFSALAWVKLR